MPEIINCYISHDKERERIANEGHRFVIQELTMKKKAIVVLGMHRSGTSAVSGLLNLLGINLGKNLLKVRPDNLKGFWEHNEILRQHENLLSQLGYSWDDVRPLPEGWQRQIKVQSIKEKIVQILNRDFSKEQIWAIKDPRMCLLAPLWNEVFRSIDVQPHFILVFRHPTEVIQSLGRRNGFHHAKSTLLWLRHNLLAEKGTRGQPRVFINFENLMSDPLSILEGISSRLKFDWPLSPQSAENKIKEFLEPELCHHKACEESATVSHDGMENTANLAYQELVKMTQGATDKNQKKFDIIFQQYELLIRSFDPITLAHIADIQAQSTYLKSPGGILNSIIALLKDLK